MALPAENILQAFFQTEEVTAEQLKQLVADEPYYAVAHFLLAKKLNNVQNEDYEQAVQKAALHFSNELFLHYNLNVVEENFVTIETAAAINVQPAFTQDAFSTVNDDEDFTDDETPEEDIAEDAILNHKLTSLLQEQAAAFEKPVEAASEIIIETTPFHRVDYFESQGIELEEGKGDDKLGTQLKRFTDWLKQMKRISPNPTELRNDAEGEQRVQNIAEHSNDSEEIVTEAMAEVLTKQGKLQQAIEIYEKLSFNNPSKSVYFAAKIAEIKS